MRTFICFLGMVFLVPPASGQDLTEKDALRKLSSESPRALVLAAEVALARADAEIQGLRPNGSLAFSRESAGGSPETFLFYEQPLSVSGRRQYLGRAASAAAESTESSVRMQLHELRTDARLAFLQLLLAQEQLKVYDSEKGNLLNIIGLLRKREEFGESSGYDRIRAERELSLLEAEQGATQATVERARSRLSSFFGATEPGPPLRAIGTLDRPVVPDLASLIGRSENRGDIQAARRMAESAALSMEAARRRRYPDPVIAGGLKSPIIDGRREYGYTLSVSVPLPLFDRGRAEMVRADLARKAALASAEATHAELGHGLRGAWEETQTRIRAAEMYRSKAVAETGDLVRMARAAYEGGEAGILEMLDAYRTQLAVRLRMLELSAHARQSALELERMVGEEVIP